MSSFAGDAMRRLGNAIAPPEPQSADQIWEIVQLASRGYGHQECCGLLLDRGLCNCDCVWNHLDRSAKIQRTNDDQPAFRASFQERARKCDQHGQTEPDATMVVVHRSHLDRELVCSWISITNELLEITTAMKALE